MSSYETKKQICEECEYLSYFWNSKNPLPKNVNPFDVDPKVKGSLPICTKCHCFMNLKWHTNLFHCPIGKW